MKERIKDMIVGILIFYSSAIIILMLINTFTLVTTINLSDSEENKNKLNQYKQEILTLEQNECTKSINNMIKLYEETSYDGKIKLYDLFWYNLEKNNYTLYYSDIKKNCNLSEEQININNYPTKVISVSTYIDKLLQNYGFYEYELLVKDIFSEKNGGMVDTTDIEYMIQKKTELEIISSLIELAKQESDNNE